MQKANVLGVGVSVTTYAEVAAEVVAAALAPRVLAVAAADVHQILQARMDPTFAAVLNSFDVVTPDGQPVRWGMRWTRQASLAERVYGPTLMLRVCERAAEAKIPIYLYGSRTETLSLLQNALSTRFPQLQIAGTRAGRFRPLTVAEQQEDAEDIMGSGAAITFVGMGCPRQEWWVHHMRSRLAMPLLGVGAAFDFHAGVVRQAPAWIQARGLEWAFRLVAEPRRLWRRYLVLTPRYLPLIASQALGVRKFEPPQHLDGADERPCPG